MATRTECENFIAEIAPLVQKYAKENGYKVASPIIAQACCEGNYGTSGLAKPPYNNHFGLKCGSSWKGRSVNMRTKEEYQVGTVTDIRANFRCYDSLEDCVKGYFSFISTKRYASLKEARSPKEYLDSIKSAGYATSSTYVSTNMAIIAKWNLDIYDWESPSDGCPYQIPTRNLGLNSRGDDVKWLQWQLNQKNNARLKVDGIFGNLTFNEVISFQGLHQLKKDGIVGKLTRAELLK